MNRENKNIWRYLFSRSGAGWRGTEVFTSRFWFDQRIFDRAPWWRRQRYFNEYIFHDSIGIYFNRILCKWRGHSLRFIDDASDHLHNRYYCHKCATWKTIARKINEAEIIAKYKEVK